MPTWKTDPGPYPVRHMRGDPFAEPADGLPSLATILKLDDSRRAGDTEEVSVQDGFGELARVLAPLSRTEYEWYDAMASWLTPRATMATEAEWQRWFSSFPHNMDRPMVSEVLVALGQRRSRSLCPEPEPLPQPREGKKDAKDKALKKDKSKAKQVGEE
eukprot:6124783-Alexandrium_andersonii.AAC.1